jgi:hypothetical protein
MNPSMKYLIYWKNICKCHSVPPSNTTIKGKERERERERGRARETGAALHYWEMCPTRLALSIL